MSEEQEAPQENQPIDLSKKENTPIEPTNNEPVTPPPFQSLPPFGQFGGGNQNLPNSTAVLVLGILSLFGCCCYGLPGLVFGIIALVLANKDRAAYATNPDLYHISSYKNLNAGRICAIVGLSLAALIIIFYIIAFTIWGFAIKDPNFLKHLMRK